MTRGFILPLLDCLLGYCPIDSRLPPTHRGAVRRTRRGNCLDKYALTLRCGEVFTQLSVFDYHDFVWLLMLLLTHPWLYLPFDCLVVVLLIAPPPHVVVPFVGLAMITLWISTPSLSVAVRYLPGPAS